MSIVWEFNMPRKKLIRRFEPRYGVSQTILDTECRYVGRELEDYLLLSVNDLRTKLSELQKQIATLEEELQARLSKTPGRERLALRCMLARDFWHMAMLYRTFIMSSSVTEATGPIRPAPEEITENDQPIPVLPFKTTLFD